LNPKILAGPPFERKFGHGLPLIFHYSEWMKRKCISFILSILPFWNPKILSGAPFKKKFGHGFPLIFHYSEWMKTKCA